jgi:ubiquitin-protein ligase
METKTESKVASTPRMRAIQGQFRKAIKEPADTLAAMKLHIVGDEVYVLASGFSGDDGEFEGIELLVKFTMPSDFPFKPPKFECLTPNGLYTPEGKICVSIGEFHSADYRPVLGFPGFTDQLVSGLIGWRSIGQGIGLLATSADEKRALAANSHEWNMKYNIQIMKDIYASFIDYSAKWNITEKNKGAVLSAYRVIMADDRICKDNIDPAILALLFE